MIEATRTEHLLRFGRAVSEIYVQTGKQTATDRHAHHNTPLPYDGQSNELTAGMLQRASLRESARDKSVV